MVLKEVFPRLFNLSSKQNSNISSIVSNGVFPHNWDFGFRRNLTVGEMDEVTRLLDILDEVRLNPSRMDYRRWKLDQSGMFSCHSFYSFIQDNGSVEESLRTIRFGKARLPQRLKFLYGKLLLGKLILVILCSGIALLCVYPLIGVCFVIWMGRV